MTDQIYDGFFLTRVDPSITTEDVMAFVLKHIKSTHFKLEDLGINLYVDPVSKHKSCLITGINMSLIEIKSAFAGKLMGRRVINIQTPDFGCPRGGDGALLSQFENVHNNLKKGHGDLPVLPVFSKSFLGKYGDLSAISASVQLDENFINVHTEEISTVGRMISCAGMTKWEGKRRANGFVCDVQMATKLEAMELVCRFNKTDKLCVSRKPFRTFSNGQPCKLDGGTSLGKAGTLFDVAGYVNQYGYVPLDAFEEGILDEEVIKIFSQECFYCGVPVQVLGLAANLGWFAGRCGCKIHRSLFRWGQENFFRYTLPRRRQKVFAGKTESNYRKNSDDKIIRLIPGMLPQYRDVDDLKQRCLAAFESEFKNSKRTLHINQTIGTVTEVKFVEERKVRNKMRQIHLVSIRVPKTKVWCSEGLAGISMATLKSLKKDQWNSYQEVKSNLWIRAKVHKITDEGSNDAVVTLQAQIPDGNEILVDSTIKIVPKPPTNERVSIHKTFSDWHKLNAKKERGLVKYNGNVMTCGEKRIGRNLQTEVEILVEGDNPLWETLSGRLFEDYVGLQITINVNVNGATRMMDSTARITKILTQDSKTTIFGVLGSIQEGIKVVVGACNFTIWAVTPHECSIWKEKTYGIPAGMEFDRNYDGGYDSDDDEEDDNEDDFNDADLQVPELVDPEPLPVDVYTDKYLGKVEIESCNDVSQQWRMNPAPDISMFDYLLTSGPQVKHQTHLQGFFSELIPRSNLLDKLDARLNASQKLAISTMLGRKLSLVKGPPGTGKSTTAAHGIIKLHHVDPGLIIVACPSNFAGEVLFKKLMSVSAELKSPLKVLRMEATSRENKWLQENNFAEKADSEVNRLHVKIRRDKMWDKDEEVNDLLTKEKVEGTAMLKKDEDDTIKKHKNRITRKYIRKADVVICTVSCASDGRLAATAIGKASHGRQISAIVVDEASLLQVPTILPLLSFGGRRLWLLGDENQLPPSVQDETAGLACLGISWMEMLLLTKFIKDQRPYTMLDTQYRMAEPIARLVSYFMYDGLVRSSSEILAKSKSRNYYTKERLPAFPEMAHKNIGVFTYQKNLDKNNRSKDKEQRPDDSFSYFNDVEVGITMKILKDLKDSKVELKEVCVISMYDAHVARLRDAIQNLSPEYSSVQVVTCDSYQGKEAKYVILNMVRSNTSNNIGFLNDKRRVNVAISRAIDYLFLVGDFRTIQSCGLKDMTLLLNLLKKAKVCVREFDKTDDGVAENGDAVELRIYLQN